MRQKMLIAVSIVFLLIFGCKGNKHAKEAFLKEFVLVTDEIVRIVDANPTMEGVEKAQDYLNAKKASLKSKFNAGKGRADEDIRDKFRTTVTDQLKKVSDLSKKYPGMKNELVALSDDIVECLLKQ